MKMNRSTKRFSIILLMIFVVLLFNTTTYAYWASNVLGSNQNSNMSLGIGEWETNYDEDVPIVLPPPENVPEYTPGDTYQPGEVIYHEGNLYLLLQGDGSVEPPGKHWQYLVVNTFIWTVQAEAYSTGDIALYEGMLYIRTHGGGGHVPDSGHQAWTIYGPQLQDYIPTMFYGNPLPNMNRYVFHNDGRIYRHSNWRTAGEAPPLNGGQGWTLINNIQPYQIGKSDYTQDSVVIYNDGYYEVADLARANSNTPGTAYNAWNRIDTLEWQWYNVYSPNNRIVTLNGGYYEIISDGNYNNDIRPGTTSNAWNRVDTLVYQQYNQYQIDSIVVYQNIVYKALAPSTGVTPGTAGSESVWQEL
jgi:hypothetical protein